MAARGERLGLAPHVVEQRWEASAAAHAAAGDADRARAARGRSARRPGLLTALPRLLADLTAEP